MWRTRVLGSRLSSSMSFRIQIDPTVQQALTNGEPVVALESTIVAHGMPYPQNLELAEEVQSILTNEGVTPATIAVRNGVCRVGLSSEELADLARAGQEGRATKCSTRELSLLMANVDNSKDDGPQWGATTVASTMALAHRAGITTFVTGGVGGVHRNGHVTMDVSADLTELSRTPVVVVSAGIKSILDIPRTLEVLETMGVPTISYGCDEFPAFFSAHSGVTSPARMDSPPAIASAYWAARDLNLPYGMLVAVPNQDPAGDNVERAIQQALKDAERKDIHGQALTPFVLKEVALKTGGDSLRSNMALVRNNARVGAEVAKAIAFQRNTTSEVTASKTTPERTRVVVLGGAVVDILARSENALIAQTSNPGVCTESEGGVARNVAEVLGRLGSRPVMYSAVGNDSRGRALIGHLEQDCGVVDTSGIQIVKDANTASYLAVLDESGDLHTAIADMDVLSRIQAPPAEALQEAEFLVMDANPPISVLRDAALKACELKVKVILDPTSVPKAQAVAQDAELMSCLSYIFPNVDEIVAMAGVVSSEEGRIHSVSGLVGKLKTIRTLGPLLLSKMCPDAHLVVTMGQDGVCLASKSGAEIDFHHFPSREGVDVRNATGAGDSLCGAFTHAMLQGKSVADSVAFGMDAAVTSLQCTDRSVSPDLSNEL